MTDTSQFNRPRPVTFDSSVGASSFESKASDFVRDLGDAARRNPVSTALIGMGALWLLAGGKPVQRASQLAHKTGLDRLPEAAADAYDSGRAALRDGIDSVAERFSGVAESASDIADSATRRVRDSGGHAVDRATRFSSDLADSASEFGRSIPDRGSELFGTARSNLSRMFNEQPLLLGAVGIAIGAGIAASLRTTELETTYLGSAADELKEKAVGLVSEQAQQVQSLVKDAANETMEEARRQGLTPDGLKAAAGAVGDKIQRVANSTTSTEQRQR
jgi:hypothetical protein